MTPRTWLLSHLWQGQAYFRLHMPPIVNESMRFRVETLKIMITNFCVRPIIVENRCRMIMVLSGDNTPKLCDAASDRNQANWARPRSGSLFAQIGRSWRRKKKKFLAASAGSIQGQFVGYIFEIWLVFHWGVHSPVFHVYICLLIDSLLRDPTHCGQNKSHWLRSSGQQSFIQSSLFPVNGLLWSVVSTEWNPGSLFHLPCSLSALASKRTRWGQVIGLDLTRIHHFREHWARWTWRHFLTISSAWIFQRALSPMCWYR